MALTDIWFLLIAVLWTGYFVLEGFDFGVGMLLPRGRPHRDRPPGRDQHHRPGLGRQRGLAAGRRRCHLRRLPRVVREPVLRLLPGAAAHPRRADRARGRLRVPRQDRQRPLAAQLGPRDRRRLGAARAALGRRVRQHRGRRPARRSTTSTPARCSPCSTRTRCSAGWPRCRCSPCTGRSSWPSRPTGTCGCAPTRWSARIGVARVAASAARSCSGRSSPTRALDLLCRCWSPRARWSPPARRHRRAGRAGRSCSPRSRSSPSR